MSRKVWIALLLLVTLSGCVVKQLQKDQDQIRIALLDLYTNQIIDNLIRAHNGMPIIQLDYTNASGMITCKQNGTLSTGQQVTNSRTIAAAISSGRNILTTISAGLGAERTNQVSVAASPVLASNEVYDAYLAFLALPGSLVVSCNPPPPCSAHICRQCGEMYYWVPIEYQKEFFKLSLLTTAQRGKALFKADDFYTVTIQEVVSEEKGQFDDSPILHIKLDKKVPNDAGFLRANINNTEVQYSTNREESVANESETDVITMYFNPKLGPATVAGFKGRLPLSAKLYLQYHQPKPPTTDDLLQRANFQLQQIQFNQVRDPGGSF